MTLESKINLAKALIRENHDVTIGEFQETMEEIESIERHMSPYLQTATGIRKFEYDVIIKNDIK